MLGSVDVALEVVSAEEVSNEVTSVEDGSMDVAEEVVDSVLELRREMEEDDDDEEEVEGATDEESAGGCPPHFPKAGLQPFPQYSTALPLSDVSFDVEQILGDVSKHTSSHTDCSRLQIWSLHKSCRRARHHTHDRSAHWSKLSV